MREVVLVHDDITARKAAESAVRESEEKLRLLADTIPQLAWMARPDGHIFWYNRRWYDYTGTTPDEMEGWGWQSVHDPAVLPEVLSRWQASISRGDAFEMVFPVKESPVGLAVGGQRLRDVGGNARLLALQDLVTLEVAAIGNDREAVDARGLAGLLRHRRQLGPVIADVGDLVRDDQVVLVIDRGLHVVANNAGATTAGGHGPCIGVCQ